MNLLPKNHQEFGKAEYWDKFFKKRGEKAFEWYGEYLQLCTNLHKYIKCNDKVLVVGCGNSKLSLDLYDAGFKNITNIDISQIVIKKMLEQNRKKRSDMKFLQMDATDMSFSNEQFSVVLDKGTLDALMTDDSIEIKTTIDKYFKEVLRVLRNGGRYLCISLLQEHILKYLSHYFPAHDCMLRIVRCFEAEQANSQTSVDGIVMPVFMVVVTKFTTLPQAILEVNLGGDQMQRLKNPEQLIDAVTAVQNAAFVCNGLYKSSIADCDEVVIDLHTPGSDKPRYTVYILDQPPARENGKYAPFIVPQGREVEWLFSTPQGRKKLLASAHQNRLAIVVLHRDQVYSSWDNVKEEIDDSIRSFAPKGLSGQIPYLSLGADVGEREIIERGHSDLSGDYVIEEVKGPDCKLYRRLIFLANQFVVQSEAFVKTVKTKGKSTKKQIDLCYLACQHHIFMCAGVQLLTLENKENDVLVVGLGGGALCTFIHEVFRNAKITAVEIDPAIQHVAKTFFGLKEDKRLKVEIEDGVSYLEKNAKTGKHFNVILFDVDSKDLSVGMSCPPKCFLEPKVINAVKDLIGDNGLFILNLVCRDNNLRDEVIQDLKGSFKSVCCYNVEEEVNEVIYCRNDETYKNLGDWKQAFESSSKNLNHLLKKMQSCDDIIDVEDFLKELKL